MIAAVCIDDSCGLQFNHRRQSRDRVVTEDLLQSARGHPLWIAPISQALFPEGGISVAPDFLERAGEGDWCFVEDQSLLPFLSRLEAMGMKSLPQSRKHWPPGRGTYVSSSHARSGVSTGQNSERPDRASAL